MLYRLHQAQCVATTGDNFSGKTQLPRISDQVTAHTGHCAHARAAMCLSSTYQDLTVCRCHTAPHISSIRQMRRANGQTVARLCEQVYRCVPLH